MNQEDQQKIDAVTEELAGPLQFRVGQEVRVRDCFGGTVGGQKTKVIEVLRSNKVRVDPKLTEDGIWHCSWLELVYD